MSLEFVARNGIISQGNIVVSGSITSTGAITISGSIASASFASTASSADNFLARGTITAQTLVVQTITSSVDFVTGSTQFGSRNTDIHTYTGSLAISGSSTFGLNVNNGTLYVSASGRVGIGTSVPLYKLHIEEASPRLFLRATGSGGDAGIYMRASSSSAGWTVKDNGNNEFLIFSDSANANRLYINSVGAVGIGVTPTSGWGSSTKVVQIGSGSLYNDSFNNTLIATNAYFNGSDNIHIATGPALRYYQEISNGEHYFQVAPGKTAGSSVAYTSSLYIKNNGNIGVNTLNPTAKLHVSGGNEVGIRSIVGGTLAPIQFSGDNNVTSGSINAYAGIVAIGRTTSGGTGVNPDIAINSSGNVGIGTTGPLTTLTVKSTNDNGYALTRPSDGTVYHWRLSTTETGGDAYNVRYNTFNNNMIFSNYLAGGTGGDIIFRTGASGAGTETERVRITSAGVLDLTLGQIKFPATQQGSANANTLDDYEEGTIDITTLTDGSATLTQYVDNRTLSYTKIGNRVYVNGNIYNQSISGTWSNPLRIPLPFTAASGDGRNRSYGAAALYNWGSSSDNVYLIEAGATYASLVSAGSGGAWGTITTTAGFTAVVNFFYVTAT